MQSLPLPVSHNNIRLEHQLVAVSARRDRVMLANDASIWIADTSGTAVTPMVCVPSVSYGALDDSGRYGAVIAGDDPAQLLVIDFQAGEVVGSRRLSDREARDGVGLEFGGAVLLAHVGHEALIWRALGGGASRLQEQSL